MIRCGTLSVLLVITPMTYTWLPLLKDTYVMPQIMGVDGLPGPTRTIVYRYHTGTQQVYDYTLTVNQQDMTKEIVWTNGKRTFRYQNE